MNFSRTLRGGMFDMMRRENTETAPPTQQPGQTGQAGYSDTVRQKRILSEQNQQQQQQQHPTGILTRPRAGVSIINGQPPQLGLPGTPGSGIGADAAGAQDSITLGQLKAHGQEAAPKQKTQQFDFRYDDSDTIMNELDEFYPYVEMPHIAKNPQKFKGSFNGEWTEASPSKRRAYMEVQLEYLESPVKDVRRKAQERLLYLLQGCFAETTSPEMQLHWVMENARTLRAVDGVASLVVSLRDASRRYAVLSEGPEKSNATGSTSNGNVDPYDELSDEFMDILAMLYFVVEVNRNDDAFGDELMAMSPPLPILLFQMIAAVKDRLPKGYPVKKVLLLLWKTLLACLGGLNEVTKAKKLARELAGLPVAEKAFTKASPMDISSFRRDTSVKYPTFAPPLSATISVPNDKLAEGSKPLPPKPNFHSTEIPTTSPRPTQSANQPATPAPTSNPLPGTPAPTPPASPGPQVQQKAKKQQYQTDQSKPYIFPFSRSSVNNPFAGSAANSGYLVPYAIAEADKLYHRHAYVSLSLYQLWETREECLREERGLGMSGLIGFSRLGLDDEIDEEEEKQMLREWKFDEEEREAEERGDTEAVKAVREKRMASKRLYRVEVLYKAIQPLLQSCVIVLLKLLLATVTSAAPTNQPPAGVTSPQQETPAELPVPPPLPSKEEIDVARHREITSKAVSGILILLLKWFKASHGLKFHFLAQLLFDSNCLLLVLKMFGLSDVAIAVQTRNEWESENFFRYCHLNCSKNPPAPTSQSSARPRPTPVKPVAILSPLSSPSQPPNQLPATPSTAGLPANKPGGPATTAKLPTDSDDVEMISEYSWRNFYSTINFLKILQKLTKHRSHRTYMLNQYKSSQILKRVLRVNHPMLQLQTLKLIKSQMPWCGRKWRGSNMKVITAIYLNCRPELRDEWLAGQETETELEEALSQEQALRSLIQFYNKRQYPTYAAGLGSPEPAQGHRRTDSTSAVTLDDPALRPKASRTASSDGTGSDMFPPRRTDLGALPYNPDMMIEFWLHEYEDVLGEVFGDGGVGYSGEWEYDIGIPPVSPRRTSYTGGPGNLGGPSNSNNSAPSSPSPSNRSTEFEGMPKAAERDDRAWNALGEMMGEDDTISDSESVVTVGELGEDARLEDIDIGPMRGRRRSENENTWAEMANTTLSMLPRSPLERRRSSSSGQHASPLRPLIPPGGRIEDINVFDDDDDLPGPMPIERETQDERERNFEAVDEVEYAYGE